MTILAAVIGDPISHSLSPVIHNYFLQKYRIDGSYQAIKLTKEEFETGLKSLISKGFSGFNITIPHKESALKICDELSEAAKIIGAVNTISVKNNKIFGDNSDAFGFVNNLKINLPDFSLSKKSNKNAIILGAGGAGRAAIYALAKEGFKKIAVVNRNLGRAEKMLLDLLPWLLENKCLAQIYSWEEIAKNLKFLSDCSLLVNCTSLGMTGQMALNFDLQNLSKSSLVCDLIYNPLETDLIKQAKLRGNMAIGGLDMLIEQAKIGFQSWFGAWPESDKLLKNKLLEKLFAN